MANSTAARNSENSWLIENQDLVEEALTEYRTSLQSVEQLGLKPLSPGLKGLIWGLRFYVLFMVAVLIINIVTTLH